METFGERIKAARTLRGWTQEELGRRVATTLGRATPIGKAAVQKWEKGETRLPEGDVLWALSEVLSIPHDVLLWGAERRPPGRRSPPSISTKKSGTAD